MISNHKLLIDKNCPMCNIYGSTFKKLNMVDQDTISPYQLVGQDLTATIDMHRAQNEVALHDTVTGTTIYGLDSMIELFSQGKSWIKKPLKFPFIYFPLKQLYKFITYNRKVIAGNKKSPVEDRTCEPDFNYFYRTLFIFFTAIFTGLVLNSYTYQITDYFGFQTPWYVEYMICFGQVVWQGVMITLWSRKNSWDYLGNMSAVSTLGGILLLPILLLQQFIELHPFLYIGYFMLVVGGMLFEHIRRCRNMHLGWIPTVSWLTFRNVVLGIIILLFS
ncbi:hypothetical protein [Nonlabens sp. Asnod3-A02]|uniref:hypothetical protein n=1 Tax=Nonlabens sp. Asnod3-A02 TaxID=3160579 RepID=UPI00386C685C